MKTVKTRVTPATYAILAKQRRKEGLPSISALFLVKCGALTDEDGAIEIVARALKLAKKKPAGEEFKLQDLFNAKTWQGFSKGARLRAGRQFKAKVDAAVDGVRAHRKSSSNHQYYVFSGNSA